jgi:ferrochelatase
MDRAVLLMAYGGPDSLDDIEPYLLDVRGGRATPAALVEEVRERYALIGGRSPLLEITRAQARALEACLNQRAPEGGYRVFVGMRHWKPYIYEAVAEIYRAGLRRVVGLCLAPYYSRMSIGAYAEKLRQAVEALPAGLDGAPALDVRLVESWNTWPGFISTAAGLVQAGLDRMRSAGREDVTVLFTAHSLPAAIMEQGDPYAAHHAETARRVAEAAGLAEGRWRIGYQSAGAVNMRWLGPSLEESLTALAGEGVRNVLVAPIGFVSDHVEILFDIDIQAKNLAAQHGIYLERTASPNDTAPFIIALAEIVEASM